MSGIPREAFDDMLGRCESMEDLAEEIAIYCLNHNVDINAEMAKSFSELPEFEW